MPNQPAACDECLAKGHYCPGLVTADGGATHLCFACDAGDPCGHIEIEIKRRQPPADARLDVPPASPVELVIEQHEERTAKVSLKTARLLSRRRKERKIMPSGIHLSEDTIRAIEAALAEKPGTELAIARRFGLGQSTVLKIGKRMTHREPAETLADQVDTVGAAHLSSEAGESPAAHQPKASDVLIDCDSEGATVVGINPAAAKVPYGARLLDPDRQYVFPIEVSLPVKPSGRAGIYAAALRELTRDRDRIQAAIDALTALLPADSLSRHQAQASQPQPQPQQGA